MSVLGIVYRFVFFLFRVYIQFNRTSRSGAVRNSPKEINILKLIIPSNNRQKKGREV